MLLNKILPLEANRVWRTYPGGKNLDVLENKQNPEDTHFPEDWIGSTTKAVNKGRENLTEEGLSSVFVNGQKYLLRYLIEKNPGALVGDLHYKKFGANSGFLLKFLDSAVRLHIQCHPTIPFAQKFLNTNSGKTEGYIILGSREDIKEPYIYFGFQNVPEKARFRQAVAEQDTEFILSCFEKIPVKPGDVFLVPGGQPHAIGEGIFMMEIMEPTDLAVRIEFERGGYLLPEDARFMGRDVDFALSMFEFDRLDLGTVKERYFIKPLTLERQGKSTLTSLFDERSTKRFAAQRLHVEGEFCLERDSFCIAVVVAGSGSIFCSGERLNVEFGDKFFIPFSAGKVNFKTDLNMDIILAGAGPLDLVS